LPIALLIGYFEYQLKTKPFVSSYAAKKYFLEKQLDSVEILILGSSQTFNGINPTYLDKKAFNLANVSQTLYYDKRLTLKYLPKLPKLKTVFINIGYFSFFYQLFDIKENWRDYYYSQHFGINYYQLNPFLLNNYSAFSVYQPLHSTKLAFANFEDETAKEILPNGYQPKYIQEAISDSTGKERVNVHNSEIFANRRKEIKDDLEDFVKQLKQKNIRVVFLTTPVYSTYSKYCDRNIVESNNQFINLLCQKYRCSYLNFFEDKRFEKDDFFDNDHLKNNGSIKLSKIINDTLGKL
jgi:hypothetical protein